MYQKLFRGLGKNEYDVIAIGGGAAGLNIASFMAKAGFKTLLIEKDEQNIGGDCLHSGCVPSKALIHAAREVKMARRAGEFGITVSGEVDMKAVRSYIESRQAIIREHENAEYLRRQNMDVVIGEAAFSGRDRVQVAGREYIGRKIVIATGSNPRPLSVPGVEAVDTVHTNETIFTVDSLPKELLVIGGGPVGIEVAQAFACLGSTVTVIHNGDTILPHDDHAMVRVLETRLAEDGVTIHTNSEAVRFLSGGEVQVRGRDGELFTVEFDTVFAAIGREVGVNGLELEKGGIRTDKNKKIELDAYLRTTNRRVFVCGDAAGGMQFTHAAELHAGIILNNFFSPRRRRLSFDSFAWVTYTDPEVAAFGLAEAELKKRGIRYEVLESDFSRDDRAIIDGYRHGKLKLFVHKGRLLGGTMVAPGAGELIQELILANTTRLPLRTIFGKTYPYPTATRINRSVLSRYYGAKLTRAAKVVLKALYH